MLDNILEARARKVSTIQHIRGAVISNALLKTVGAQLGLRECLRVDSRVPDREVRPSNFPSVAPRRRQHRVLSAVHRALLVEKQGKRFEGKDSFCTEWRQPLIDWGLAQQQQKKKKKKKFYSLRCKKKTASVWFLILFSIVLLLVQYNIAILFTLLLLISHQTNENGD